MSTLPCLNLTDTLLPVVSGFIDSLSVFKKAFPGQQNYKQETLVKAVLNTSYAAHDATEDVKTFRPGSGCVTFCQCDACVDKLPDCGEYTKSSCKAPYVNWAYNNCKAYCGFCHLKCVYSPWLDLTPCSPVCGRGKKVQVRTVALVKPGTIKPTAVVKVPVTEMLIVTDKTHVQEPVVDTGVLDHHGPLIHVDPDTVKDVAIAGAATGVAAAGGVALGTLKVLWKKDFTALLAPKLKSKPLFLGIK
uniref:Uncharacterized protein n=1 Tax=Magallana gigas TaxID=29159 RepID=K1RBT6_MAGGI